MDKRFFIGHWRLAKNHATGKFCGYFDMYFFLQVFLVQFLEANINGYFFIKVSIVIPLIGNAIC
jgi:lipid-A-disaccharide synthase-like uncharacterized protein